MAPQASAGRPLETPHQNGVIFLIRHVPRASISPCPCLNAVSHRGDVKPSQDYLRHKCSVNVMTPRGRPDPTYTIGPVVPSKEILCVTCATSRHFRNSSVMVNNPSTVPIAVAPFLNPGSKIHDADNDEVIRYAWTAWSPHQFRQILPNDSSCRCSNSLTFNSLGRLHGPWLRLPVLCDYPSCTARVAAWTHLSEAVQVCLCCINDIISLHIDVRDDTQMHPIEFKTPERKGDVKVRTFGK